MKSACISLRDKIRRLYRVADARLGCTAGQGTVEYVGLILLVAAMMFGVVALLKNQHIAEGKELGKLLITKIKSAVDSVK